MFYRGGMILSKSWAKVTASLMFLSDTMILSLADKTSSIPESPVDMRRWSIIKRLLDLFLLNFKLHLAFCSKTSQELRKLPYKLPEIQICLSSLTCLSCLSRMSWLSYLSWWPCDQDDHGDYDITMTTMTEVSEYCFFDRIRIRIIFGIRILTEYEYE